MAKAITLKKRLNIVKDFNTFLHEESKIIPFFPRTFGVFDGLDDYEVNLAQMTDEEYDQYLIRQASRYNWGKNSKRGKHGKSKKCGSKKIKPMTEMDYNMFDPSTLDERRIYFYEDIEDKDSAKVFYSLFEFDSYLQAQGIHVPDEEASAIARRDESHCCISSIMQAAYGELELVSDSTYGGLVWMMGLDM